LLCQTNHKLRAGTRCTNCGGKGATLQRPGWAGNHIGFYPFPTIADETREEHRRRVLGERLRSTSGRDAAGGHLLKFDFDQGPPRVAFFNTKRSGGSGP
jgi:hypothetical protein